MKKIFLKTLIFVSIISFIAPLFVSADGMVIWPDYDNWRYRDEESQLAFINFEEGIQKMIISVGLKEDTGSGVWLFPVPANPDKVVIDVVDQFPEWYGSDIFSSAESNLRDIRLALGITQGYPIFFPERHYYQTASINAIPELGADSLGSMVKQDVVVHEHLEKDGITTEIITAKTSLGLYDYLKNKSLNVAEGSIPVLGNYIGKDFTFVVSWLTENTVVNATSTQEYYEYNYRYPYYEKANKGVFVAFPTDQAYYPLMPTSVYESKVIPTTVFVKGFFDPEIFKDIKPYTEVNYYSDNYSNKTPEIFYSNQDSVNPLKYTKITINSPSKLLSEDLWIDKGAPARVNYASFIHFHPVIVFIMIFIILSALIGLIAGLICFKEARRLNGFWKFMILGLFNCLTLLGLIIATIFARTKTIKTEDKELFYSLRKKGYRVGGLRMSDWRKIIFVPIFSVLFVIFSYLIIYLLGLGL